MICRKCGTRVSDNAFICPKCGTKLNSFVSANNTPPNMMNTNNMPPRMPNNRKRPSRKAVWIPAVLLIISLIAGGCFGTWMWVDGREPNPKQPKTVAAQKPKDFTYNTDKINKPETTPDQSQIDDMSGSKEDGEKLSKDIQKVNNYLAKEEKKLKKNYDKITMDNIDSYLSDLSYTLDEIGEGEIKDYYIGDDYSIQIELTSGLSYFYKPEIEGYKASGNLPKLKVATYQPFYSDFGPKYSDLVNEGAQKISDTFDAYDYDKRDNHKDDCLVDKELTIEKCFEMPKYSVLLWDGHGGYISDVGPTLLTATENTEENCTKYYKAIENDEIIAYDSCLAITSKFVEKYFDKDSFNNSVIYLGTCLSAQDDTLAEAFINKGAAAVYGDTETISVSYCDKMMKSVAESLSTKDGENAFCNVQEALDNAKEENGESDSKTGAEVVLYTGETENFTLDWYEDEVNAEREIVLVLDNSSSMDGEPLDQTKKAATKFVSAMYKESALTGIVTYSGEAEKQANFSRRVNYMKNVINQIETEGNTNIEAGLQEAEEMLDDGNAKKKIIVLMSDGEPNEGLEGEELVEYADKLKSKGIYIYTLGFFSDVEGEKSTPQQLMEDIANEGCHYEVDDADNLKYFFGDVADQINGQKFIYVRIACPVDVKVSHNGETLDSDKDSLNTRTKFGSLSFETEREDFSYDDNDEYDEDDNDSDQVKILRLKDGEIYDIAIDGTGSGRMDYTVKYMDDNGDYKDSREFENIKISGNTQIDTKANSADDTKLNVDSDGDGTYDKIYVASANSKGKEVDQTRHNILRGTTIGCGVVALISLIMLLIGINRRKKYS